MEPSGLQLPPLQLLDEVFTSTHNLLMTPPEGKEEEPPGGGTTWRRNHLEEEKPLVPPPSFPSLFTKAKGEH